MGNFTTSKAVSVRNFDFMKFFGILVLFLGLSMSGWGATITPIRTDVSGFTSWTDNAVSGTTYLQLNTATSSTVTPSMDFSTYSSKSLDFTARTFGGGNTAQSTITVSISIDNGSSWTILGTRVPTSSSLLSQTTFDLTSFNSTQVKIKFETLGASSSKGVGIDDITISGSPLPTKLAITSISPTTPTSGSTFNVTVQAQDGSSVAGNVSANTAISLSNTGGGTIGGTTTGTITAGSNSVTISGVTLSSAGTGATLTATRISGDALTAGTSASFNVLAAAPSTVSSGMVFGTQTTTSIPLTSWTTGNGANRIVVRRAGGSATAPTNGTDYAVSATLGTGTVIYNGNSNALTATGLTAGSQYTFDIYEYNGSGATANYGSVYSASRYTLSTEPATHSATFTASSLASTSLTLNFTTSSTTLGYLIVRKDGASAFTGSPVDGTGYSVGNSIGDGTVAAVVTTTSTTASITGLAAATQYTYSIIPFGRYSTNTESYNYYTGGNIPALTVSTLATAPTAASAVTAVTRAANSINISWVNGNGAGRIVVARTTSATAPVAATSYTSNSADFTDVLNSTTATGNIVVYNGTGSTNTLTITGLSTSTNYKFDVYEYNGSGVTLNYSAAATSPSTIYTLAAEPTTQASGVTFSSVTATGMTINFTKGDATTGRLVLVKAGSAVDSNPVDGTGYTVSATFGSGTPVVGTGNYAVYGGSGSSVTVTGLTANTTYYVAVYEFNGTVTGTTTNFLTTSPATGSQITLVTAPSAPTALTFSSITYNSMKATFTAPASAPTGYLVLRRATTAVSGTPAGGTVYTQGQTNIGGGTNEVVYVGSTPWTNYDQTSLTDNTTYNYAVYSYNGSGTQTNYSTVLTGSQLTAVIDAPVASAATSVSSTGFTTNWSAISGAAGYKLDVSTSSNFGTNSPTTSSEGFESGLGGAYTSSSLTLSTGSWSFTNSGLASTGTGNFYSGTTSCQLKASTGVATSPSFGSITTVTFYAKSPNGSSTVDVKKIVNGGSATLVETKTITSSWAQYTVAVNDNSSDIKISFVNGTQYLLIDDVVFNYSTFTPSLLSGYNNLSVSGNSQTVTGLSPNTTYYYRLRAVGGNSTSANSNVITAATNNTIPVASGDVNATTLPVCTTCDVTVANGATLTISDAKTYNSVTVAAGGKLNITGTLTAPLTLESNGSGTATLVDSYSTPTLSATVQQYLPQGRNWYVGLPVSSGSASTLTAAGLGSSVSYWNEAGSAWVNSYTGSLTPGLGYIAVSNAGSGTNNTSFTGTLNAGNVTVPLTRKGATKAGFNLIANPYPSYLDAMQAINANANIQKTIWYRTRSTGASPLYKFETVNTTSGEGTNSAGTGTVTGIVPPMQAFWVRTNTDNNSITFTNAMRYHANPTISGNPVTTTPLKAPAANTATNKLLRLEVAKGAATDETVVYFNPNATSGFDAYDSPKWSNANAAIPELYTIASAETLAINGLPEIIYNTEIPLGFYAGAESVYSIRAKELRNFDSSTRVILKDGSTEYDLTNGDTYEFNSPAYNSTNRFSIIFRSAGTTTGLNNNAQSRRNVYINANNELVIKAPAKASYGIYNALGQKLTDGVIGSGSAIVRGLQEAGIIIVKITDNGKTTSDRVLMK